MRSCDDWRPSKYVFRRGRYVARLAQDGVAAASQLIASRVASCYQDRSLPYFRGDLLDLGCGRAPFFNLYADLVDSAIGVDWSESPHELRHADVIANLGNGIPFRDGTFDTVLASDLLEHLPDTSLALRECHRVLEPGGHLILNVPFLYWVHEAPHDYWRFTADGLHLLATRHGFTVEELAPIGGALDVLFDLLGKLFVRIPWVGTGLASGLQRPIALAGRSPVAKWFLHGANVLPLGYFCVLQKPAAPLLP